MFTRYLIVRPDIPWIQGDVPAPDPSEAVKFLESRLRTPALVQHDWLVYVAPNLFPLPQTAWSGGDPVLIEMLEGLTPIATIPQSRPLLPHSHRAA